ncbi:MAG: hypothetical protein KC964_14850 [Candidatus Omnitrophica bacterium]|nr:hypothetical protein [Candidatus Omnitrophota bacterium]
MPEYLEVLIRSGEKYPPALALAIHHSYSATFSSKEALANALAQKLEHFLENQRTFPFVLAKALKSQGVWIREGEYLWIVDVRKSKTMIDYKKEKGKLVVQAEGDEEFLLACWVSSDFEIFQDPVSYFDLSEKEIDRLLEF